MPLPPKSKKKKKRKKLDKGKSNNSLAAPDQELSDSEEDEIDEGEDEQTILDKAIAKKFPDFKKAV